MGYWYGNATDDTSLKEVASKSLEIVSTLKKEKQEDSNRIKSLETRLDAVTSSLEQMMNILTIQYGTPTKGPSSPRKRRRIEDVSGSGCVRRQISLNEDDNQPKNTSLLSGSSSSGQVSKPQSLPPNVPRETTKLPNTKNPVKKKTNCTVSKKSSESRKKTNASEQMMLAATSHGNRRFEKEFTKQSVSWFLNETAVRRLDVYCQNSYNGVSRQTKSRALKVWEAAQEYCKDENQVDLLFRARHRPQPDPNTEEYGEWKKNLMDAANEVAIKMNSHLLKKFNADLKTEKKEVYRRQKSKHLDPKTAQVSSMITLLEDIKQATNKWANVLKERAEREAQLEQEEKERQEMDVKQKEKECQEMDEVAAEDQQE